MDFHGSSGEAYTTGVEIHALAPGMETIDEDDSYRDLHAILRWMLSGTGPPWTVEALDGTARLYRVPAAGRVGMARRVTGNSGPP